MLWKKPRAGLRVRFRIFIPLQGASWTVLFDWPCPLWPCLLCFICLVLNPSLVWGQVVTHIVDAPRRGRAKQVWAKHCCGELRK